VATIATSKIRGKHGSTTSLKAAVQPGHWLRALIYNNNKVKIKFTLVQALRLSTGHMAHRGSRGITLPFLDLDTRRG
jgi:hypothetical protein